eukprot:comp15487_c0_seq1/m.12479 comp15487_c0_seq1/g.12479  ORF comp15487_c0_seq1/g.12479 comp15487_c0_seq1/m.12479 type:complete len:595 (-) comp15487_c0_seq1:828-2612(-)
MSVDVLWRHKQRPSLVATLDDMERRRQESIHELIQSEEAYLSDVEKIITFYRDPLVAQNILPEEDVREIFGDIDAIYTVNTQFHKTLLQRQVEQFPVVQDISDLLTMFVAEAYDPYHNFCPSIKKAMTHACRLKIVYPEYAKFLAEVSGNKAVGPLGLDSYLLKPLQRLTKYPLLVSAILNHTRPSHKSYERTRLALQEAMDCVGRINEDTRRLEDMTRLFEVQNVLDFSNFPQEPVLPTSGRKFLFSRELVVEVVTKKSNGKREQQRMYGFLFNDMLILAKRPRGKTLPSGTQPPTRQQGGLDGIPPSSSSSSQSLHQLTSTNTKPRRSVSIGMKSKPKQEKPGPKSDHRFMVLFEPLYFDMAAFGLSENQQLLMLTSQDGALFTIPLVEKINNGWPELLEETVTSYQRGNHTVSPLSRPTTSREMAHSSDHLLNSECSRPRAESKLHASNSCGSNGTISPFSNADDDCVSERSSEQPPQPPEQSLDLPPAKETPRKRYTLSFGFIGRMSRSLSSRKSSAGSQTNLDNAQIVEEDIDEIPDKIIPQASVAVARIGGDHTSVFGDADINRSAAHAHESQRYLKSTTAVVATTGN